MIRAFLATIRDKWNLHRIKAARERLEYLLEHVPRYWTAQNIGGGASIPLGRVTLDQALEKLSKRGERIAHVEREWAFIALKPKVTENDES